MQCLRRTAIVCFLLTYIYFVRSSQLLYYLIYSNKLKNKYYYYIYLFIYFILYIERKTLTGLIGQELRKIKINTIYGI